MLLEAYPAEVKALAQSARRLIRQLLPAVQEAWGEPPDQVRLCCGPEAERRRRRGFGGIAPWQRLNVLSPQRSHLL
jgi:hypothetical protein